MIKICPICNHEFETPYDFQKYCSSDCKRLAKNALARERYKKDKTKFEEAQRRYRSKHREKVNSYQRRYRTVNRDKKLQYFRKYYQEHKEELKVRRRDYYAIHKFDHLINECKKKHNNCFSCPTPDGGCLYD